MGYIHVKHGIIRRHTDIAKLKRHYFRLLRDTLLLPKNDPDRQGTGYGRGAGNLYSVPYGVFDTTAAVKIPVENYTSRR